MIGNYIQVMVDQRVTTEIVVGFESQVADVREMFRNNDKNVVKFFISQHDFKYLLQFYRTEIEEYQKIVKLSLKMKL